MFTEIREIIFSADLAIFDNLVYQVGPDKLFSAIQQSLII